MINMLTSLFEAALVFAFRAHSGQKRNGTEIPYISHLMAVSALVMEAGGFLARKNYPAAGTVGARSLSYNSEIYIS